MTKVTKPASGSVKRTGIGGDSSRDLGRTMLPSALLLSGTNAINSPSQTRLPSRSLFSKWPPLLPFVTAVMRTRMARVLTGWSKAIQLGPSALG